MTKEIVILWILSNFIALAAFGMTGVFVSSWAWIFGIGMFNQKKYNE